MDVCRNNLCSGKLAPGAASETAFLCALRKSCCTYQKASGDKAIQRGKWVLPPQPSQPTSLRKPGQLVARCWTCFPWVFLKGTLHLKNSQLADQLGIQLINSAETPISFLCAQRKPVHLLVPVRSTVGGGGQIDRSTVNFGKR